MEKKEKSLQEKNNELHEIILLLLEQIKDLQCSGNCTACLAQAPLSFN
jgi:hypothetical protein